MTSRLVPFRRVLAGAVLCTTACGGNGSSSDAGASTGGGGGAVNMNGDFASCDGQGTPSEPTCSEYTGSQVHAALDYLMARCPASTGETFSLSARCDTSRPGCICVTGVSDLQANVYIYQTATQDPFATAEFQCGAPVQSCFGGLTAPGGATH